MPNGFPEGDFKIINEGTQQQLIVQYGGMSYGTDTRFHRNYGTVKENYGHTNDPIFKLGTPEKDDYEYWWFSTITDQWNRPDNYLMTTYKDIRSRFALQLSFLRKVMPAKVPAEHQAAFDAFVAEYAEKKKLPAHIFKHIGYREQLLGAFIRKMRRSGTYIRLSDTQSMTADLRLWGSGRQYVTKWKTEDGYLFEEGKPDLVLGVEQSGERYIIAMKKRGEGPHQQWTFKK